jgi:hypothetical protein
MATEKSVPIERPARTAFSARIRDVATRKGREPLNFLFESRSSVKHSRRMRIHIAPGVATQRDVARLLH